MSDALGTEVSIAELQGLLKEMSEVGKVHFWLLTSFFIAPSISSFNSSKLLLILSLLFFSICGLFDWKWNKISVIPCDTMIDILSLLSVPAFCLCCLSLPSVSAVCLCCLSLLSVSAVCLCHLSLLSVSALSSIPAVSAVCCPFASASSDDGAFGLFVLF